MGTSVLKTGVLITAILLFTPLAATNAADGPLQNPQETSRSGSPTAILAHYMPWFEAKPVSRRWGWHWTMNAFDPEKSVNGQRPIASHYSPLIGPYDSGDPAVLEYHLLTMKLAGIDGVIVDWYGLQDFRDYAALHRNTQELIKQVQRLGMKFAICYEDQTIPALVEAGRVDPGNRVAHAVCEIDWVAQNWFSMSGYQRLDDQPILLSFGQTGLSDAEWSQCFAEVKAKVAYFSLHHRRTAAVGAFDWPIPQEGLNAVDRFYMEKGGWPQSLPVAFPRFVDIYAQAKVQRSYGRVDDNEGKTLRSTLEKALASKAPVIQIATWNDWGEGTIVEPSHEFGYRDLEAIQELRRRLAPRPGLTATSEQLRLPLKLLERRRLHPDREPMKQLDRIAELLAAGQLSEAQRELGQ